MDGDTLSIATEEQSAPVEFKALFTGAASEFFRIWIVNTLLTIVTLGVYAAWAKVRTRQYFYAHTLIDDYPFEYTGRPVAILRGNLFVGVGFLIYYLIGTFNPVFSSLVFAVFWAVLPFLIYKSLRFNARNSMYRNIRFRFTGTLKEGYVTFLLFPMLIPFTLGALAPYWAFRQKKYFFDHFTFGGSTNRFTGGAGEFYRIYLLAGALLVGIVFLLFVVVGGGAFTYGGTMQMGFVFASLAPALFVFLFVVAQQFIRARVTNYCWGRTEMAPLRFRSTIKPSRLIWIQISNVVASVLSLGLLVPWAKVRRTRYLLENMVIITREEGLDSFASTSEPEENAIGEAATDFFGFDIGL
jgi:uncharacterized membrane protein YjgN (DUF898 family)